MDLLSASGSEFNAETMVCGFRESVQTCGVDSDFRLDFDFWDAPHKPLPLPIGCSAVYVFALAKSVCGGFPENRVLKVGKAGQNSNARFQSQHYGFSAPSTVSKAIQYNPVIWPLLGYRRDTNQTVGDWLKTNTRRWNFYIQGTEVGLLGYLETYLKACLGPALEGVNTREPS